MNLLLWRHGAADETDAPSDPLADRLRGLNSRGRRQVALVADWLHARLPGDYTVLSSATLRARQTAEALTADFRILDALSPQCSPAETLNATGWPDHRGTVIVVGHQPALGALAALLLFGSEAPLSIKKGALWWIASRDREDRTSNVLRAVVTPDLVLASATTVLPPVRNAA